LGTHDVLLQVSDNGFGFLQPQPDILDSRAWALQGLERNA
jgi:hypothetical protein